MSLKDAEMWVPFNCAAGAALPPALEWPLIDQHQDGGGHDDDDDDDDDDDERMMTMAGYRRYQEQPSGCQDLSLTWYTSADPPPYYLILQKSSF